MLAQIAGSVAKIQRAGETVVAASSAIGFLCVARTGGGSPSAGFNQIAFARGVAAHLAGIAEAALCGATTARLPVLACQVALLLGFCDPVSTHR
ncbi:hypothetical protein HRbin30_02013 [bacterium HR30]|nr:hypothetical protein HRbin30_02013 [bacterium HR30]